MIFKCIRIMLAAIALGVLAMGAVAIGSTAHAATKPQIYRDFGSNLALSGFDAVAYHSQGAPVRGIGQFKTTWNGAEWRFASAANLAAFTANPAKYAPQYGGYCAWAAAQGYTAKGNPNNWRIVGGKLYLNYNSKVQTEWEKDIPGFVKKADANWPAVLDR
jgi:YHS domain-containing protein